MVSQVTEIQTVENCSFQRKTKISLAKEDPVKQNFGCKDHDASKLLVIRAVDSVSVDWKNYDYKDV